MTRLLALYMGSLILRSIGIALVAGVCSWKIRDVAMRHAVWVVVLGAVLLMPAVDYLLPATWVPARIQRVAAQQPVTFRIVSASPPAVSQLLVPAAAVSAQSKPVDRWNLAAALYALVAFAMFIRLTLGYRKIRRLRRTGRTIASSVWNEIVASHRPRWRLPVLLESEAVQVPMTVGLVRPAVILPADWKSWDDWKMRAVLLHEVAHIRRNDWGIAVIVAVAKCAYWLNPLSWFLERKLSQLAEQASDDASLCRTQNATQYAEILLGFAAAAQNGGRLMKGGVAMAHHKIQERIERVLGNPQWGTGTVRTAGWALVMIIAVPVLYSAAALQVPSEPVKAPVPTFSAAFGRNPLPQTPAAGPQAAPQSAPVNVTTIRESSPNPTVDPRAMYQQMEVIKQQLQRASVELQAKPHEEQKANQATGGAAPEPPNTSEKFATADFLREDAKRLEERIGELNLTIPQNMEHVNAVLEAVERSIAKIDKVIEAINSAGTSRGEPATNSSNRIFVTGRVQKPGDFELGDPLTVLQALALAGGFQDYARPDAISIIRMNGDSSTLFQFNYSNVIKGVSTSQNIYLTNGDVVVVP